LDEALDKFNDLFGKERIFWDFYDELVEKDLKISGLKREAIAAPELSEAVRDYDKSEGGCLIDRLAEMFKLSDRQKLATQFLVSHSDQTFRKKFVAAKTVPAGVFITWWDLWKRNKSAKSTLFVEEHQQVRINSQVLKM